MTQSPAIDRFKRALDLVPFISANPGWSIEKLANHFGVSKKEMARDLVTLHMCGLPGYSHGELIDLIYDDDYVAVLNTQNLSEPRDLTVDERTAILLGLELVKQIDDDEALHEKIQKLQAKLNAGSVSRTVNLNSAITHSPLSKFLLDAVASKSNIAFTYTSRSDSTPSQRSVAPTKLYQSGEYLYLEAYCFASNGIRNFRSDRMSECRLDSKQQPIPENFVEQQERVKTVKALLNPSARLFLEENRQIVAATEPLGERILATFTIGDMDWLIKALLALPGLEAILEPNSALERALELAEEIVELYG